MKEIKDLIKKAKKFLITAEHALNLGDYDSCVSKDLLETARIFVQKLENYLTTWMKT